MNVPVSSEYENSRYLSHCEQRNFLAIFNQDDDDDDHDDDDDSVVEALILRALLILVGGLVAISDWWPLT